MCDNEIIMLGMFITACALVLLAMIHQTCQIRELYKMFAAKVDADNIKTLNKWKETREERKEV